MTLTLPAQMECAVAIATFPNGTPPATPAALAKCSLMIYAPTRTAAEAHLDTVLHALQPGSPPARAATLSWREAPKDQQPSRPVRPGVQFVL